MQSLTNRYDIPQTRQKCLTERHYKPLQRRQISYGGNNSCGWRNLLLYFAVTKSTFRDYFESPSHCVKQLHCWICFLLFHSYQKSFCITLLFDLKLLVISVCPNKLIHSQIKEVPHFLMRASVSWCKLDRGHNIFFPKLYIMLFRNNINIFFQFYSCMKSLCQKIKMFFFLWSIWWWRETHRRGRGSWKYFYRQILIDHTKFLSHLRIFSYIALSLCLGLFLHLCKCFCNTFIA